MALHCTDHLTQEHRIILRAIFVLAAMVDLAKGGRMPESEDVETLLDFFRRFADDHHQGKEEFILFPALRISDAGKAKGPLQQMMLEHNQERSFVEGLENALRTRQPAEFADYGGRLADMLGTHIYKEDHILFDLIEKTLTKEEDSRLTQDMLAVDQLMPPWLYEVFTNNVTRLEWKYLGKAA